MFIISLIQSSFDKVLVPDLWKISIIVPIPKKAKPDSLNDYRPIALTSLVMKAFEKEIKKYIMTVAVAVCISRWERCRWCKTVFAKCSLSSSGKLWAVCAAFVVDFSSAFYFLQPVILGQKQKFHFNHGLVSWIMTFFNRQATEG